MKFIASYVNWSGVLCHAEVTVHETKWPEREGYCFYAEALATLGCGKNARTAEEAAYVLVADHGTVIKVDQLGERND